MIKVAYQIAEKKNGVFSKLRLDILVATEKKNNFYPYLTHNIRNTSNWLEIQALPHF